MVRQNNEGSSALIVAAEENFEEAAKVLLRNGAQVDLQNHNALMNINMAEILLANGANPDLQDNDGFSFLILAVNNQLLGVVRLLLQNGATVYRISSDSLHLSWQLS